LWNSNGPSLLKVHVKMPYFCGYPIIDPNGPKIVLRKTSNIKNWNCEIKMNPNYWKSMQKGAIWWTPNQCVLCMEFESENVII
jgi:hypothetical protein